MKSGLLFLLFHLGLIATAAGQDAQSKWRVRTQVGYAIALTPYKTGAATDALISHDNDHLLAPIFRIEYQPWRRFGLIFQVQAATFTPDANRRAELETTLTERFGNAYFVEPFFFGNQLTESWSINANAYFGGFYVAQLKWLTLIPSLQIGTTSFDARRLTVDLKERDSNQRQRFFYERTDAGEPFTATLDQFTVLGSLLVSWPVSARVSVDANVQAYIFWSELAYREELIDLFSTERTTIQLPYPTQITTLSFSLGLGYQF
ncbi:MAG: hypothetical protein AAFZ52_10620 [Bacteroidota bacterium]